MKASQRDVVVVVSGTSWDGVWSSERQIAERLAAAVEVLWVDPPMSPLTLARDPAARRALAGAGGPRLLRRVRPGITRLTPVVTPGVSRPVLARAADAGVRLAIRAAARRLGARVTAMLVASQADVFGAAPASARTVFYCTDDFAAGAGLMGISPLLARRAEWRQVRAADVTVVISEVLARRWRLDGVDTIVVPNGCAAEVFAGIDDVAPAADLGLPGPVAGLVGHVSDRIDRRYLDAVADTGASLLLVGPRDPDYDLGGLLDRPNVRWTGARPFEALPAYLRVIDVGLTPYADTPFNRASFPLKTLEYLAAGRPVVSTDLPATRWLGTDLITVADTPRPAAPPRCPPPWRPPATRP
ncbi:glycosyltransferase [Frankia sp. CNm7]|uniref:glycosyltransferase n=1 Tax=Frankia nepalensis TaxID=1836974 RepID=UPI001932BBA4|nr:glycosyltransferase [Frankia nepalensis]MBL7524463.1 glycosyltransferase [Frankia nepalensis]